MQVYTGSGCFPDFVGFIFRGLNGVVPANAIFSENERKIKRERNRAGLQAARARGRVGGRPRGLSEEAKKKLSLPLAYTGMEKV